MPFSKRESFRRSFFPTAIRLWNNLKPSIRNAPSLHSLKKLLYKDLPEKPTIYYYGERWASVHHARIRMQCSKLNNDLYCKLYVRDSPTCRCGAPKETACHFFMHCPLYHNIRTELFTTITKHTACNMEILLHGDASLSEDANKSIFNAVHRFIHDSDRFT